MMKKRKLVLQELFLLVIAAGTCYSSCRAGSAVVQIREGGDDQQQLPGMQMPGYQQGDGCGTLRQDFVDDKSSSNNRRNLAAKQNHLKVELKRRISASPKLLLEQAMRHDQARRISFDKRQSSNRTTAAKTKLASSKEDDEIVEMESSVESGAALGSGEYFMDAQLGTPPVHVSLIIDTGSDLTWAQCRPCLHCFPQQDEIFDPARSSSFSHISCQNPDCSLVTSSCAAANTTRCDYLYSYGDASNTSGHLAYETLRLRLGGRHMPRKSRNMLEAVVSGVVFGCGHSNQGLFRGASGLLGLGRGSLSFASQLRPALGRKFSYCLVDRDSNLSSTIGFGDAFAFRRHGESAFQFTPFVAAPVDTFYYLDIRSLRLDGDQAIASIEAAGLAIQADGRGGTIIDSGTTLTYLAQATYDALEAGIVSRMGKYPRAEAFDVLGVCYNLSTAAARMALPGLSIVFGNGATMKLPAGNVFIRPDPSEDVHCLAILPTDGMSILGNFQQQNLHLLYDGDNARLGFMHMDCASL